MAGSGARRESCGLEDEVLLEERLRLHSGYASEDGENLLMPRSRDLPKEEELVHLWVYRVSAFGIDGGRKRFECHATRKEMNKDLKQRFDLLKMLRE